MGEQKTVHCYKPFFKFSLRYIYEKGRKNRNIKSDQMIE